MCLFSVGVTDCLFTAKTFASCCSYVQWKRNGLEFVDFLKFFNSSKTIFRITTLLIVKD